MYFIFNGEIKAEKDIADFYQMRSDDKVDLLTKYFYSLRNKYTHTVDYAETHEDGQTQWFRSPYNYGGDNSILTRIIYKDGDQKKKIEWTIGVKSNFAESDIIRLILIFQIRQKLLNIKDGKEFVTEFLNRMNYRVIGYRFIEELEANIKQIKEFKLYYLDQSPYFQPPKPILGIAHLMADTFIQLHNKLYPIERFLIKPAYHEQFPEHHLKLYPGVREVRLDQYLEFVIGVNQQIQQLTEKK